jgi:hypothetical protein
LPFDGGELLNNYHKEISGNLDLAVRKIEGYREIPMPQ